MPLIRFFIILLTLFTITHHAYANEKPRVAMKTDLGTFVIELYEQEAPITVKNFLNYVDSKFYDGTIFHRVVPGFVVQGGGMTFDFAEKATQDAIKNESFNGLKNDYKTLAMARRSDPDSATSQFYINLQSNPNLNATDTKAGYTVFGIVIEGMDVVEKIAKEPRGMFKAYPEAPNYAVRILSATRVNHSATDPMQKTSPINTSAGTSTTP